MVETKPDSHSLQEEHMVAALGEHVTRFIIQTVLSIPAEKPKNRALKTLKLRQLNCLLNI